MTDTNQLNIDEKEKKKQLKDKKAELKAKKATVPGEIKSFMRAVPVVLIAIAVFITLCFITGETGTFGSFVSRVSKGLFSYIAYTIPAFIAWHAIFYFDDVKKHKVLKRAIFSIVFLITLSEIAYIIPNIAADSVYNASELYANGIECRGGGFIGGSFAYLITNVLGLGKVGLFIVIAMTIALYSVYFFYGQKSDLYLFFLGKLRQLVGIGARIEKNSQIKKSRSEEEKLEKKRADDDKKNAAFYRDEYFNTDGGMSCLEIPELGISKTMKSNTPSHRLMETVIHSEDTSAADTVKTEVSSAPSANRDKRIFDANESVYSAPEAKIKFVRTDDAEGFKPSDIVYEAVTETDTKLDVNPETEAPKKDVAIEKNEAYTEANDQKSAETYFVTSENNAEFTRETAAFYGIDDSADSIFTSDFDPLDIAVNEKRAAKASTCVQNAVSEPKGFKESITAITCEQNEQLEKLRLAEEEKEKEERLRAEADTAMKEAIAKENARIAEERMASEAARRAEEAIRAKDAKSISNEIYAPPANDHRSTYERIRNIADINSDYEQQYGASISRNSASDQYRFVKETIHEPRRHYSQGIFLSNTPSASEVVRNAETVTIKNNDIDQQEISHATTAEVKASEISISSDKAYTDAKPEVVFPTFVSEDRNDSQTEKAVDDTFSISDNSISETAEIKLDNSESAANTAIFTFEPATASNSYEKTEETSERKIAEQIIFSSESDAVSETAVPEISDKPFASSSATLEISREVLEISLSPDDNLEKTSDEDTNIVTEALLESDSDDSDNHENFTEEDAEVFEPRTEIPEDQRNPAISGYREMFDIFREDTTKNEISESDSTDITNEQNEKSDIPVTSTTDTESSTNDSDVKEDITTESFSDDAYNDEETMDSEPPFEIDDTIVKKTETTEVKPSKPDYSSYKLPPYDLLKPGTTDDIDLINEEIQSGAEKLISTLEAFNIRATMRGIERGPRVTRYSIVPAKGIRVGQIEKLSDDIVMGLAAETIRIEAPIPGKSAVGIEIPNKISSIVSLRDLIESEQFTAKNSKTTVCIGKSVEGLLVYGDLSAMPHLLIAGATGMGKSVCMNSLILSILYKARPDEVKFIMIDPKKVEFAPYKEIPHLLVPVVTEPKQAAGALFWAVEEMNKRYDVLEKFGSKNIDSYNERVKANPDLGDPMHKIVIFIDELNDLMMQMRDPVENLITMIAQKARAAGIHLVIGTQRPSVNVITGVIKSNIPTRIACKVTSGIDSRTIIDVNGAEKLIGKGDMLFAMPDFPTPKRVQGAYVSEGETVAVVDFIKAQCSGASYDEEAFEDMKRAAVKCDKSKKNDDVIDDGDDESNENIYTDKRFIAAVELAIKSGTIATSYLQRKLTMGYGKAAKYIDIMEELGIVAPKNGAKPREILISMDEWRERVSRYT